LLDTSTLFNKALISVASTGSGGFVETKEEGFSVVAAND
jgi:hypothetical protein